MIILIYKTIYKHIVMNIKTKIWSLTLILGVVFSCTDLDEELRGVITSDITVNGIVTDSGGVKRQHPPQRKKKKENKQTN
jgi:hypothetical protein